MLGLCDCIHPLPPSGFCPIGWQDRQVEDQWRLVRTKLGSGGGAGRREGGGGAPATTLRWSGHLSPLLAIFCPPLEPVFLISGGAGGGHKQRSLC
jgi:hypothetical protein